MSAPSNRYPKSSGANAPAPPTLQSHLLITTRRTTTIGNFNAQVGQEQTLSCYEPGMIAWLHLKRPGTEPVKHFLRRTLIEESAYNHPVLIIKRICDPGMSEGNIKYLALLMTSFGNMSPENWLQAREIRKDIKWSVPVAHHRSWDKWPLLSVGTDAIPVLCLDATSSLGNTKQSYAKLDMLVDISLDQLRPFQTQPGKRQPRICAQSFYDLMSRLDMPNDAHLYFSPLQHVGQGQSSGPIVPSRVPLSVLSIPKTLNRNPPSQPVGSGNTSTQQLGNPALIMNFAMRESDRFTGPLPVQGRGGTVDSRVVSQKSHTKGQQGGQLSSLPTFRPTSDKISLLRCRNPAGASTSSTTSREFFRLDTARQVTLKLSSPTVDCEPVSKMAMIIAEIEGSVFDHLDFRFIRNEGNTTAVVIAPKGDSEFGTLKPIDIQKTVFECTTLASVVAQGRERSLLLTVEPVLVANKLAWFSRTDEKAVTSQERIRQNVMEQRSSWGLDPSVPPSIVVVLGGGELFYVLILDH